MRVSCKIWGARLRYLAVRTPCERSKAGASYHGDLYYWGQSWWPKWAYTCLQQLPRSVAADATEERLRPWTAGLFRCFLQMYSYCQTVLRSLLQIEKDEAHDWYYRMGIATYYSIMDLWRCLWSAGQRNDSLGFQKSLQEGGLNCFPLLHHSNCSSMRDEFIPFC